MLDKQKLANHLLDNFKQGKAQGWDEKQAATALADAISEYVQGAVVKGVTVEVRNNANAIIGTGTQNNSVGLT
jgi:hypothetical protein